MNVGILFLFFIGSGYRTNKKIRQDTMPPKKFPVFDKIISFVGKRFKYLNLHIFRKNSSNFNFSIKSGLNFNLFLFDREFFYLQNDLSRFLNLFFISEIIISVSVDVKIL